MRQYESVVPMTAERKMTVTWTYAPSQSSVQRLLGEHRFGYDPMRLAKEQTLSGLGIVVQDHQAPLRAWIEAVAKANDVEPDNPVFLEALAANAAINLINFIGWLA